MRPIPQSESPSLYGTQVAFDFQGGVSAKNLMSLETSSMILIADADRVCRERLAKLLMEDGFDVTCVPSGREAINTICKCSVDVAIIDTHLSDIEGDKVVPIIKDMNRCIRVVVTTAEHSDELESRVRCSEIVYYALKSEGFQHILDAVRTAARSRLREKVLRPA